MRRFVSYSFKLITQSNEVGALKSEIQNYKEIKKVKTKFGSKLAIFSNILHAYCRGWDWAVLLLDEWIPAQLAQYNEFIENGFENKALMRVTTTRCGYEWIE